MATLKNTLASLQEKAKERTVKTQSIEYDLETLVKKIDKGVIKLDPEYQRRHRWNDETSSRLIESLILNIPIPTIYLSQDFDVDAETEESRYSVIDGQQRLTAIFNFFKNKFPISSLEILNDLNGSFYKDLPPFLIRRLEERTLKCLRIDSTIDPQVKIDIFERLNSGAVKLEAQELRNAVLGGPFNNLCKELAQDNNFRILLQINPENPEASNRVKKMEDVEIVLRFFALINDKYKTYKRTQEKGFKDFLTDTMNEYNDKNQDLYYALTTEFHETMELVLTYFGKNAFAKYTKDSDGLRMQSKFNLAVFDALAPNIHYFLKKGVKDFRKKNKSFLKLFEDSQFYASIYGSYADASKLQYRIEKTRQVLK
jgi:uncharacterized protein with ParB-like and HNH nuclease domain